MISTKYAFIFIHIQKTAGNSIQAALQDYADDQLVFRPSGGKVSCEDGRQGLDVFNPALGFDRPKHKHATAQDYRNVIGDRFYDFTRFTCIRNPFDRVISRTAFKTGSIARRPAADELLLPAPLTDHLTADGKLAVENYIRFERLAEDFAAICCKLGIKPRNLPHLNASRREASYRDYYTDETRALVARTYAEDLELFGYSF